MAGILDVETHGFQGASELGQFVRKTKPAVDKERAVFVFHFDEWIVEPWPIGIEIGAKAI